MWFCQSLTCCLPLTCAQVVAVSKPLKLTYSWGKASQRQRPASHLGSRPSSAAEPSLDPFNERSAPLGAFEVLPLSQGVAGS